jgi:hypothetical protein
MGTIGRVIMKIRDYLVEKEGADKADSIIGSWEVQDLLTPPPEQESIESSYHEEVDMKVEEVQALIAESMKGAAQQFAELLKPVNESIASLRTEVQGVQKQFAEGEDAQARREFTAFCEGLKTRVLPAEIPTLVDQMMNLRKAPAVEFSEGGEKKSRSAVDDYRLKLQNRAETVQFGEFATGDKAHERQEGSEDALALSRKAQEFQEAEAKAGRTVTIADAVTHVRREAQKGGTK